MKLKQLKIEKVSYGTPTISFGRAGCISFSKAAVDNIQWLIAGQGIGFSQDEDHPKDWYIMPCVSELKIRVQKGKKIEKVAFNSIYVCKKIAESLEIHDKKSFMLRISLTPIEHGGNIYHALIIPKP